MHCLIAIQKQSCTATYKLDNFDLKLPEPSVTPSADPSITPPADDPPAENILDAAKLNLRANWTAGMHADRSVYWTFTLGDDKISVSDDPRTPANQQTIEDT